MKIIAFAIIIVTFVRTSVLSYPIVDDEEHLAPLVRQKRQQETKFNIRDPGVARLSHQGTILNNNHHSLDGTGYVEKDFSSHGGLRPDAYGGKLDYLHKPSGASLGVGADHMRRGGTDVRASGTWNFIQRPNADVGLTGHYGRHFGPGGGRPDYGVFLGGKVRF